jgi:thioredoxin-related protein
MWKRRCVSVALALTALSAMAGLARAAEDKLWMTNLDAAKAKAKAEKKMLLVDCTGSTWCGFCKKLKSEVFDTEEFKKAAKDYVLAVLDYPPPPKMAQAPEHLRKFAKQYKIHGYPAVLVFDADGQLMFKLGGYKPGSGPEEYLERIATSLKAHEELAGKRKGLESVQGLDRAKLLDKLIEGYVKLGNEPDEIEAWDKEIVTLDADNQAGLKVKHQIRMAMAEYAELAGAKKWKEAVAALEKATELPGISDEQKQDIYFSIGNVYFNQKNYVGVVDALNKALEAAPDSAKAKSIKGMIQRFKTMAEKQSGGKKGNDKPKGKTKKID